MAFGFVSEPLIPFGGFETSRMAQGEPGVPAGFRWRKQDYHVKAVRASGRNWGDCTHGSGERYVRRHTYEVLTEEGLTFRISFQRTFGKSPVSRHRWWIHGVADE